MKEKEARILLSLFYIKVIPFTQIQRAYKYVKLKILFYF